MERNDGMNVIDCFGDGRARGRAHGETARDFIHGAVARWEAATMADSRERDILAYAQRFLSTTGLVAAVERALPDLAAEMRGIAEGSGVAYPLIAAYNLMDEQWWYDLGLGAVEPGCSTLSLSNSRETLLAQNMDLPAFMDGSQVILRLRDEAGGESLVLSSAGLIGLTGINRRGFAICVNTLLMLNHDAAGIPVAFVLRGALAASGAAEAVRFLQTIPHASGQHYAVAARHGVTSLECSAGGAAISHEPSAGAMIHTNHPLASGDVDAAALGLIEDRGRVANSRMRLQTLEDRIGGIASGDDIVAFLSDRSTPVCMVASPTYALQTFASMVFSIADEPSARFCLGQPGKAPWQSVAFS